MPDDAWTIIVVEDSFDDRQVLATALEYYGIQVYAVGSRDDCDALLAEVQPTMVITDLAMPEADGWEVLSTVRRNPATQRVPVVAMTSYHSVAVEEEVLHGGFDAFIAKPIDLGILMDQLNAVISE